MATPHTLDRPDDDVPIPRWRYVAAGLAALLLVGGAITWLARPESTDCAENVEKVETARGARCVGLTDGSYAFTADLRNVYGLIEKENRRVTKEAAKQDGRPYVSIVYLLGMAPGRGDSNTTESIRHEVEGAYTAQYEVNHGRAHGQTPQIRLLLGDTGSEKAQRDFTLDRIKARRGPDRIVAAAGLGTSLTGTNAMISKLSDLDIAAFGSVITADELEKNDGLVRVAAPNADEAAAAVQFLTEKHRKDKVLIVQDANKNDLYTKTLASRFAAELPKDRLAAPEPMQYDSSKSQLATYFSNQMPNLCLDPPGVVYFAGRGRDLPDFLAPLANRRCKTDRRITVLSGDDVSQSAQAEGFDDVKQALQYGNIRLLYTGLAHPGAWVKAPAVYQKNAIVPFLAGGTFTETFKDDALDDGQAIMGYDAVLTAVTTIRKSVHLENSHQAIERDAVVQMLRTINGANAVPGASGWISLRNNGSPERKAIPIIEISSNGDTRTVSVSASNGKPYASE